MLPAENRLKNKEDFSQIMRDGSRAKFGPLMFFTQNTASCPRIGFVISKRVSKLSSERNQVRRHLREIFRGIVTDLAGKDVVVSVLSLPKNGRTDLEDATKRWQKSL